MFRRSGILHRMEIGSRVDHFWMQLAREIDWFSKKRKKSVLQKKVVNVGERVRPGRRRTLFS